MSDLSAFMIPPPPSTLAKRKQQQQQQQEQMESVKAVSPLIASIQQKLMSPTEDKVREHTLSMVRMEHCQLFDINVPHTYRLTYRQTDILHVP